MSSDFFYFMSSLPMLKLTGEGAPTPEEFDQTADARLNEKEAALLRRLSLVPPAEQTEEDEALPVLRRWNQWQTAMRNAMAERRGRRLQTDPARFMRTAQDLFPGHLKALEAGLDMPTAAARQEAWEELQWSFLDELEAGCYFDFQAAAVYKLKLLLLHSRRRSDEEGNRRFEGMLTELLRQAGEKRKLVE